jgi:hypothetical protein
LSSIVVVVVVESVVTEDAEDEEEIDEEDPLWKATLQMAKGDRKAAIKLLEDPDALMAHPEIKALLAASESSTTEDWETEIVAATEKVAIETSETPVKATKASADSPVPTKDGEEDVVEAEEESVLQDVDPREHLNIVFIGKS